MNIKKLTAAQVGYELVMLVVVIGVFVTAQATSFWLLYGFGAFLFLGALMIVLRAGSDALFEYLDELGPISWAVSFIPCILAAFIGLVLDR